MVENKKTKREKDIKSKLLAAVAMLLVSSIMMVSTTYAWFTLSTAPEVTGITTTIGANGNLEIALSPENGMGANVGDATLNTTTWDLKNLTWGNLVDLGYAGNVYGLEKLTLAPAELAATGDAANGYTLNASAALATPSYGSDGRISGLEANASIGGTDMSAAVDAKSYAPGTAYEEGEYEYGVRAVGTSSGMSEQESKFKNSVNAIGTYANAAVTAASNSLSQNGSALASMLVQHAEAGSGDASDYASHVDALVALTTTLKDAPVQIDNALRAALAAAATTLENTEDAANYDLAIAAIEGKNEDGTYTNTVDSLIATYATGDVKTQLEAIAAQRDAIATKVNAAYDAAAALDKTQTVTWAMVSPILNNLMNTSNEQSVKIKGFTIAEIKEKFDAKDMNFLLGLATDCQIELYEGSGVYYDIAAVANNITAKTTATVTSSSMGMTVTLENVIIKTMFTGTPSLTTLKNAANNGITPAGSDGTAVLDAFYGYVVDLMVRTNAADSNLLLQTKAAQRVYSDSANEETMGKGATIVFTTPNQADVASINDLCKSIRVVFFDPSNANKIFGLAKVTTVLIEEGNVETVDENGAPTTVAGYIITGSLELCEMVEDTNKAGLFLAGDVKTSAVLCPLTQNVPQAISAMVYLDGNDVTSADVLAEGNVVGMLNLQFASDAELKPMENSALRNGNTTQNP